MIQLLESGVLRVIENELSRLDPSAQEFALKEIKVFTEILIRFIESKSDKKET